MFLTTHVDLPFSGWVMHLAGFPQGLPTPMTAVTASTGDTHRGLAFQALRQLLAIQGIQTQHVVLRPSNTNVREILAANTNLLPTTWTVAEDPPNATTVTYCHTVFRRKCQELIAGDNESLLIPEGNHPQIIVAADASVRHTETLGQTPHKQGSAGWVIAGMTPGDLRFGHRNLGHVTDTHKAELKAIELALQSMMDDPMSKSRRKIIAGVLVLTDSASAFALLASGQETPIPTVARIRTLVDQLKVRVEFKWVKGHHKNAWNKAADALAALEQRPPGEGKKQKTAEKEILDKLQQSIAAAHQSIRAKTLTTQSTSAPAHQNCQCLP